MRDWLNRRIEGFLDNVIFAAIVALGAIIWSSLRQLSAPIVFVIGLAAFALILFIFKTIRDILSKKPKEHKANTELPTSALPSHAYITDTYIRGRVIYLMDLLAPGAKPIISNRTIEDCEIRGPAMITLLGGVTLADNNFDGDINSLFIEVAEKRIIIGAIGLQGCVFRGCRFIAIGIIGTREQIEQAKKGFTQSTSHRETKER
jgi:hypothetical protein